MRLSCYLRSAVRRFHSGRRTVLQWRNASHMQSPIFKKSPRYAETLWKYFNAPGNALFVTTNVVTLAGMMVYSTVSTMCRQATVIESLENGFPVERGMESIETEERKYYTREDSVPQASSEVPIVVPQATLHRKEVVVSAQQTVLSESSESQHLQSPTVYLVKMTLFYLFYSYYMYKNSIEKGLKVDNETLDKLLTKISETNAETGTIADAEFYNHWRKEFLVLFKNLSKSQQFNVPDPEDFPAELQTVLKRLVSNNMTYYSDFYEFYENTNDISQRRLLQLWYYDNSRNFCKQNNFNNEALYEQMVFESSQWNTKLFEKYISILNAPGSLRFQSMLSSNFQNGISSVSFETVLTVLKGLIASDTKHKNDHIVKVVSLLRKNSTINRKKKLRILLPTEDKKPLLDQIITPEVRKQAYSAMAKNAVALKLLSTLGGVLPSR